MSEKTEVKKNKLWAKLKIQEELNSWQGVEGGGMSNLKIMVTNPYYEKEYVALDVPLSRWINFLDNHRLGNEKCFSFLDISGTHAVINPENFASIEVVEVAE